MATRDLFKTASRQSDGLLEWAAWAHVQGEASEMEFFESEHDAKAWAQEAADDNAQVYVVRVVWQNAWERKRP